MKEILNYVWNVPAIKILEMAGGVVLTALVVFSLVMYWEFKKWK